MKKRGPYTQFLRKCLFLKVLVFAKKVDWLFWKSWLFSKLRTPFFHLVAHLFLWSTKLKKGVLNFEKKSTFLKKSINFFAKLSTFKNRHFRKNWVLASFDFWRQKRTHGHSSWCCQLDIHDREPRLLFLADNTTFARTKASPTHTRPS